LATDKKNIMMEAAQVTCGLLTGPCRYKETWWWNEEIAETVRGKKIKNGNWKRKLEKNVERVQEEKTKCRKLFPQ